MPPPPSDPLITCPNCKSEIKLTDSLAAPLIESTRRDYEQRLAEKTAEAARHEQAIRQREDALKRAQETLDQQIADRLRLDRPRIAAEEAKKAQLAAASDLQQKSAELASLQQALTANNVKLAEAQKAQAAILVQQRQLDDMKRELDLTIEQRTQANLAAERQKARTEAEAAMQLKFAEKELRLSEKDNTIAAMKKQLEEAQRKAEQGSQQSQGEALELQLEALLAGRFPHDQILPVPKGEHGGDILHRVFHPASSPTQPAGTILWEFKRTKNWSDAWLPKLRDDQRAATAEFAIIVSAVLPKTIDSFDLLDGIWITHPRCLLPLALALRHSLLELATARQAAQGQQSKMELTYQYLTGPKFRHRVQAIVEKFDAMREDLNTERKTMTKLWAKREAQITAVLDSTAGLYGDLQGIAGSSVQEIQGLEIKLFDSPP